MKNALQHLSKSVLTPVRLIAAVSVTNATNQKKTLGLQGPSDLAERILVISNEEIEDIIKINKSFQKTRFLIKGVTERTKNAEK